MPSGLNSQGTAQCHLVHFHIYRKIRCRYQSEKSGIIPCVLPCRKGSKIAPQLTRGLSWAPQSPTRRIPDSTRACRRPCIFSPVSTALRVTHLQGRLWACLLSAVCTAANLQTLVPPFFGETRESPAGTPSPCSWVWGTVAASANKPFVCSQPPHQLIPPTCPNLVFRHICTSLGKMSPDTEVKLNFKL